MSYKSRRKPVVLTAEERSKLESWTRRTTTQQRLAVRARIILLCAEGFKNQEVARQLDLCRPTVGKWRERFQAERLEGLTDEPRPGTPRSISDAKVEEIVTMTLEQAILDYLKHRNLNPVPFVWTATADRIFSKVETICERISLTGH